MLIESYFGFKIDLNTESGEFSAGGWDTQMRADTLPALRELLDAFREANKGFVSFQVQEFVYDALVPAQELVTIIGVTQYGRFIAQRQDEDSVEPYMEEIAGRHAERAHILPDERNEPILAEIYTLEAERTALGERMEALSNTLHRKSLRDLRQERGIHNAHEDFEVD